MLAIEPSKVKPSSARPRYQAVTKEVNSDGRETNSARSGERGSKNG